MGITSVPVTVRNLADPSQFWEGSFVVDTGAVDCVVPRQRLEAIGLTSRSKRLYTLADGSKIEMDITTAQVEFMGEIAGVTIAMGDDSCEPLLGVTALESMGIEVDPHNQELTKLGAIRLVGIRPVTGPSPT
jgi:clan AA aspartic protease